MKRITEEKVLEIVKSRTFFVHKYRYSHEKVRKLTRRMCKDGKIELYMFDGRYFHYRMPK